MEEIMKTNMGNLDRAIRIILAIVLVVLYFSGVVSVPVGIVFLIVAGIFLLTSLVSFCPLYVPFNISTRKKND